MFERTAKAFLAALLALVLTAAPVSGAKGAEAFDAPEGYNAHDYELMLAFLEQEDEEGVKNGQKLSAGYDPDDPETWTGVAWTEGEERSLLSLTAYYAGLTGELDLSECLSLERVIVPGGTMTAINVGDCIALRYLNCGGNCISEIELGNCVSMKFLYCFSNELTSIDLSSCAELDTLNCTDNQISVLDVSHFPDLFTLDCARNLLTEIDVSGSPLLFYIDCSENALTELDLSSCEGVNTVVCRGNEIEAIDFSVCPGLWSFDCRENRLTEIDVSACPHIYFNHVSMIGSGTIGMGSMDGGDYYAFEAVPAEGFEFVCWRNASDGTLVSSNRNFVCYRYYLDGIEPELVACFRDLNPGPRGDADGDGDADAADALLVLRHAMGLVCLSDEVLARCDVDESGEVDVMDALIIFRYAMGLLPEL